MSKTQDTQKTEAIGKMMLYDMIGKDPATGEGITAKSFDASLKAMGDVSRIDLRINSNGGSVFEGMAIYSTLMSHPARKVVHIEGIAASMASIIAMVGDEIHMAANALFMIHEPRASAEGTAEDILQTASALESMSENCVSVYADRSGGDRATIKQQMKAETWFSAQEAKAAGFVTHITPNKQITAHYDESHFTNVPPWAQERLKQFSPPLVEGKSMTEESQESKPETPPVDEVVDVAALTAKATADERDRCGRINAKCALAQRPDLAQTFIDDPTMSVSDVSDKLLDVVCKKNKPIGDEGSNDNGQSPEDPNAKYKAEFTSNPLYAKSMKEADYIAMRRVDDGLDTLTAPMNA